MQGDIFFDVAAVFVPAMSEPLAGAVYMSEKFGMKTIIDGTSSYVQITPKLTLPLDVTRGTTRCMHAFLYDPRQHGNVKATVASSTRNAQLHPSDAPNVSGAAAVVVDTSAPSGNEKEPEAEWRFAKWTKRLCGLAPAAVAHLQDNTVGCEAPRDVPNK